MCSLKGGNVKTVDTKDQSNAIVYGMFVDTVNTKIKACNALNAMFVETVDTGICGSYTTLYTEYYEVWKLYSTLYKVASSPAKREGYCRSTVSSVLWV